MFKMRGADLSHWNYDRGAIDFDMVHRSGIDFVILKAGGHESSTYRDKTFDTMYNAASLSGLHVGAYYFAGKNFLTARQGSADARHFAELLKGKSFDMPIYLDIEAQPKGHRAEVTDAAIAFCERLEDMGAFVGIYSADVAGWVERLEMPRLELYTKWVARWGSKPQHVPKYAMWQYTNNGTVTGIRGNVDLNECYENFPKVIGGRFNAF